MNKKPVKQLPQNLKDILKDIGENSVLFHLYTRIYHTKWRAFKNLQEDGCDIVLLNASTNKILKIEVKTRQSLYSTAKSKNTKRSKQFQVTRNEYKALDFLVCCWFDYNDFFIIPKKDLVSTNTTIRIRINRGKDGSYGPNERYRNDWDAILDKL